MALRVGSDLALNDKGRGTELQVVLAYEWLQRNKRVMLTPMETRIKQAVWEWFSALQATELQRVGEEDEGRGEDGHVWGGTA